MSATSRGNARAVLTTSLVKASIARGRREDARARVRARDAERRGELPPPRPPHRRPRRTKGPSASAGSGRASSGRRGGTARGSGDAPPRRPRSPAGHRAPLRNPPPGSTPPAHRRRRRRRRAETGHAADPDLGVRAGGGATASERGPRRRAPGTPPPRRFRAGASSSHATRRPSPFPPARGRAMPGRRPPSPARPRGSPPPRGPASPFVVRVSSVSRLRFARAQSAPLAPLARVAASRARLARRSMNILAASSDWSCSMRLAAASDRLDLAPRARFGGVTALRRERRNARYTLNFPSPHLSRCASRRWQSRAVIGTRFSAVLELRARASRTPRGPRRRTGARRPRPPLAALFVFPSSSPPSPSPRARARTAGVPAHSTVRA